MRSDKPKKSHQWPFEFAAASLLALVSLPSAAEIHRCIIQGQQVIQDRPCANPIARPPPAVKLAAPSTKPRPPIGDPAYEQARAQERLANIKSWSQQAGASLQQDMAQVQAQCGQAGIAEPFIGAKTDWVRTCSTWGRPISILKNTTASGTTEMWTHQRGTLFFGPTGLLRTIISKK